MTQIEILKKAIAKANSSTTFDLIVSPDFDWDWFCRDEYRKIIFSHDFAKAFWAKERNEQYDHVWQHHLQQMVLEADPLSYLAKFLE